MEEYDFEELVKATENFSPKRLVGKGSHGSVYKGTVKDNKLVAIKKPTYSSEVVHDSSKLDNEIRVLLSLRENPHVINLLGTSQDSANNKKLLVMELMPNGSLHDLLHVCTTPPTWPKRVEIAIRVARAVQFLHEGKPLVIHRDIKSANILFDSNWNAKLADFGLAVLQSDDQVSQLPAGTIGYLDPCYTTPSKLSKKNDVFSFGVVLLEIISGTKAIDMCRTPASIVDWAVPLIGELRVREICDARIALLPTYMEATMRHMLCIAARCVSSNEELRPSIGEITRVIENHGVVQRVRFPIWMSFLRSVILMRRQRKLARRWQARCATQQGDVHTHISTSGKLLLKEVLAEQYA
ncbi:serine/threonine-protein kinase-like protein At5g23170 [Quercus lobata]|uniref:non-specific serine/threonine protein kinase n=1 Tax=Quercus lobata TaxID=97700 RepID=A0A7N2R0E7_QUELO|nr:serine/threonine-protein kinase-like protein At5g23170 [Quercus lobata]